MYNTITINPAYAGSRGVMTALALHRSQWLGFAGAPTTNMVSLHTPLNNSNLGLGIGFVNDAIGPLIENQFSTDFSYSLKLKNNNKLNFGLKASLFNRKFDTNLLDVYDVTDPTFQSDLVYNLNPNFGIGAYYYSNKYYIGLSVPNLINTPNTVNSNIALGNEYQHLYAIAGYVFELNKDVMFKPTVLFKGIKGAPLQTDVSANFMIYNKLTLGCAYRWNAAVSALAGFQVSKSLFIGYAYDSDTTPIKNYNNGSHELFIQYEFLINTKKINTPRFF